MSNVRLTIEICLDHAAGEAAANFIKKGGGVMPGVDPAHVSLISSAGMTIMDKNLILSDGGVVYHQDGLYNRTTAAKSRTFSKLVHPSKHESKADEVLDSKGSLWDVVNIEAEGNAYLWGGDMDVVRENVGGVFVVKEKVREQSE